MTKPIGLSQAGEAVIESNRDWDVLDVDELAELSAQLDQIIPDDDRERDALSKARGLIRSALKRNLRAVTSQTHLLADQPAKAELEVMNANAERRAVAS